MKTDISIGELVAIDFRAASVFKEAGIDFCCGGKMNIEEACNEKGIDQTAVRKKLADLVSEPADTISRETILNQIKKLSGEHEFAGGAMDKINSITKGYDVPADGCNTYHVTFRLLEQFEDDLHVHVHLENNILFPKALKAVN